MIRTFQDFEEATDKAKFVLGAIGTYKCSDLYRTALIADEYDAQRNVTIAKVAPMMFTASGARVHDPTASNNHIASNFFNRLNTQRCMYSLGNGVSFVDPYEAADGMVDETKEALGGIRFDHAIKDAGYYALIHGVSYMFWDGAKCNVFSATEFVPLLDEVTGELMAGIRFWQLDSLRPMNVVLYEADGYTSYRMESGALSETQEKTAYKVVTEYTDAGGTLSSIGSNYGSLPIVRVFGSRLQQSTLVGMRESIDAYDIVKSGFANDMTDCAEVYWLVENYGGMTDDDLAQFLDRLKLNHVASVDTQAGGKVAPYSQEIPHGARQALLEEIRNGLYEDFGGLDVHTVAAGATNDHIDAAYQPMDEMASDFERWVGDAIVKLLGLLGISDTPIFKRQRISNMREQVDMLVQEAEWLDAGTIIRKLPNLTPDEANAVAAYAREDDMGRMGVGSSE